MLDALDRKILAAYQCDTRRVAVDIGGEVGLSPAAVQRRLKRMRADGVIAAEIAVIDRKSVGANITCITSVAMAGNAPANVALDKFKREMGASPEVQQCYHVTGAFDFVLIITVATIADYAAFARSRFETNPAVARFDTYVVLDAVKVGLSVPVGTSSS